ncbi:PRD domain-containing protein [Oceanobacillus jeddahense]|uniref:PRD domain-containing protein n=1 Tax=Oceanobacillus jeddahense TaxID=1462527 RepID=A0ABY5JRN4_9BACI|nr:PRD domain-containing protein [Oceanobacillus jeddahense]UUI02455.1 PRD domain-containing protein [Oceanobacillus jeddahense]
MNKLEMNKKLTILLDGQIITKQAYDVTNQTYDYLAAKFNKEPIENSDMFWTHLCMALTRIENGEELEGPSQAIVDDIYQTPYKEEIKEVIEYVKHKFHHELPREEQDYFYLHLHGVMENNK